MKRIFVFSDTHTFHNQLNIPEADIAIFAGDESNKRNPYLNEVEARNFLEWYSVLPIKHKVFVAGNHSMAIFNKLIRKEEYPKLIFLEHESANVEGLNIFGSPFSPRFGDWAYMYKRNIGKEVWSSIPDDTDILITHSPPKSILDLTDDMETGNLVRMGCKSLYNRVLELGIDYHIYGHCHSNSKLMFNNNGIYKSEKFKTTFINAACLDHSGQFYQGHIIEI